MYNPDSLLRVQAMNKSTFSLLLLTYICMHCLLVFFVTFFVSCLWRYVLAVWMWAIAFWICIQEIFVKPIESTAQWRNTLYKSSLLLLLLVDLKYDNFSRHVSSKWKGEGCSAGLGEIVFYISLSQSLEQICIPQVFLK